MARAHFLHETALEQALNLQRTPPLLPEEQGKMYEALFSKWKRQTYLAARAALSTYFTREEVYRMFRCLRDNGFKVE